MEIWDSGYGIISLHIFANIYEAEAFIREAAMIEAIGLENLTNRCVGSYYGVSKNWRPRQRTDFGARLLKNAYIIFKHERCRPLFEHELGYFFLLQQLILDKTCIFQLSDKPLT